MTQADTAMAVGPARELDMGNDVNFLSFVALGIVLQVLDQCRVRLKQLKKEAGAGGAQQVASVAREVRTQTRQATLLLESLREIAPGKDPLNQEVADDLTEMTRLLAEVARTDATATQDLEFVVEVAGTAGEINALIERHLSLT